MTRTKLYFLQEVSAKLADTLSDFEVLELLKERYHNGETATIALKIGDDVISETDLLANGKNTLADELFALHELKLEAALNEAIDNFLTVKQVEE